MNFDAQPHEPQQGGERPRVIVNMNKAVKAPESRQPENTELLKLAADIRKLEADFTNAESMRNPRAELQKLETMKLEYHQKRVENAETTLKDPGASPLKREQAQKALENAQLNLKDIKDTRTMIDAQMAELRLAAPVASSGEAPQKGVSKDVQFMSGDEMRRLGRELRQSHEPEPLVLPEQDSSDRPLTADQQRQLQEMRREVRDANMKIVSPLSDVVVSPLTAEPPKKKGFIDRFLGR